MKNIIFNEKNVTDIILKKIRQIEIKPKFPPNLPYSKEIFIQINPQFMLDIISQEIWVKEDWRTWEPFMNHFFIEYKACGHPMHNKRVHLPIKKEWKKAKKFSLNRHQTDIWHPAKYMPQWASRLTIVPTEIEFVGLIAVVNFKAYLNGTLL